MLMQMVWQKVEGACATLVIAEEKRLSAPTSFAASAMPFLCCCPVPHDLATPSTAELQHSNINRRVAFIPLHKHPSNFAISHTPTNQVVIVSSAITPRGVPLNK